MRKFAGITAGAAVMCGIVAATADATPAGNAAVGFTAEAVDGHSVISIDTGGLVIQDSMLKIEDTAGTVLAAAPLRFRIDEFEFPIAARISDRTATLTPLIDRAHARYEPVALPYAEQAPWQNEYDRESAAWNRLSSTILTGATLGTLIGGIGGSAAGCVLGGIAGATVAAATIVGLFGPFLPAAAIGCLGGVIAVGALGTLAGQLLVTAPITVAAAIQYFTTIAAPAPQPGK
ncbi:hypothetical protein AB0L57_21140 [Nocardia sp. NPDC052254]|uniref:hypothetical protein n=1 Tax=Nocardia sp. NPDC052254 TaxID=3155681 RepID=UPI0034282902